MLYQTLYEDLPAPIVSIVEPLLWWGAVLLCMLVALNLFQNYKKAELGKPFRLGSFTFAFLFGIGRAIENIRKFYLASDRVNIVKGWVGLGPKIEGIELILRISYYVLAWFSLTIFYYNTEKYVFQKKTKFIFMFSAIGEGCVSIALYFTSGIVQIIFQVFAVIGFFLCGVAPIVLYLLMALKSTGILRQSAFFAASGLIFLVLAIMAELPESMFVAYLVTGQLLDAWLVALVSPISMMIGLVFLLIGYKKMFSGLY
jgi:hypothetical protein